MLYSVVLVGETGTVPRVSPPVEKPVPVQEVTLAEPQVRLEELPRLMVPGVAVRLTTGFCR